MEEEEEEDEIVEETTEAETTPDLKALASFLPVFTRPGFQFGAWEHPPKQGNMFELPYVTLGLEATNFVRMAYKAGWIKHFNWADWRTSDEGTKLWQNVDEIASASPDQLSKLLTLYIRGDRFNEGLLNSGFESGILTAIVQRADALLRT